jgi:putative glutamine amidotransferase
MRPVIGISCRIGVDEAWCPPLVCVRQGYVDAILMAGGMPWLIPPQTDGSTLREIYERLDGVLLPGGADIDPAHYSAEPHPKLGTLEPQRDILELALARWCVADHKPLLAICRGMQILNVALGGTLYQDLDSQRPSSLNHARGDHEQSWTNADHALKLDPDSRWAALLGTTELSVNSLHHQALNVVAPGLRIAGSAPDGVVEAVEGADGTWILGIQCHPETLWQTVDSRWRNVFRAFVEASAHPAES